MKIYHKLVRDKIPHIIEAAGKKCDITIEKDHDKLIELLEMKVLEEWQEYQESKDIEEIADVLEVLLALAERKGTSKEQLFAIAAEKSEKRGGFNKGIILHSVHD